MIFTKSVNRDHESKDADPIVRYVTTGIGGDAVVGATARGVLLAGQWPTFKTQRDIDQFITQIEKAWIQHESIKETGLYLNEREVKTKMRIEIFGTTDNVDIDNIDAATIKQ